MNDYENDDMELLKITNFKDSLENLISEHPKMKIPWCPDFLKNRQVKINKGSVHFHHKATRFLDLRDLKFLKIHLNVFMRL